jgi:hypothetical protein
MNFSILERYITFDKGKKTIKLDSLEVKGLTAVQEVCRETGLLIPEMAKLSRKGYVNRSGVDLPVLC